MGSEDWEGSALSRSQGVARQKEWLWDTACFPAEEAASGSASLSGVPLGSLVSRSGRRLLPGKLSTCDRLLSNEGGDQERTSEGVGETAQRFRTLAALVEDPHSIPSLPLLLWFNRL